MMSTPPNTHTSLCPQTFPALLDLYRHDFLPKSVTICGYSRSKMSDEDLRTKIKPYLVKKDAAPDAVVEEFLGHVYYRSGERRQCSVEGVCAFGIVGVAVHGCVVK